MAALASVFVRVLPDAKQFEPQLKRQLAKINARFVGEKAGKSFASGMAKAMAGAFAAAGVARFFQSAITGASDLQETTSKVGVIFGNQGDAIKKFASTANLSLGQTKQQAMDAAATFGVFGKSAGLSGKDLTGFSTDLVSLTADMASFSNTTPEEAITAVGAALRGESEPIRKYGVLLDDATLRNRALKLGLIDSVKTALTPQNKALAAQSEIMAQTGDAQGDFQRTSGGLANQQRILSARFTDFKTTLGTAALPMITKFVTFLNDKAIPGVQSAAKTFKEDWLPVIKDVGRWLENNKGKLAAVAAVVVTLTAVTKLHTLAMAVQAAGGFVAFLASALKGIKLVQIATRVWTALTWLQTVATRALGAGMMLAYLAKANIGIKLVQVATKAWTAVQWLLNVAMRANPIGIVITAITLLVAGIVLAWKKNETFRRVVLGVWNAVKNAVTSAIQTVTRTVKGWQEGLSNTWEKIKNTFRAGVARVALFMADFALKIINGASAAFGWVPGLGGKLNSAKEAVQKFRDSVNRSLNGINDEGITITVNPKTGRNINRWFRENRGGATGADLSAVGGSLGVHTSGLSSTPPRIKATATDFRNEASADLVSRIQREWRAFRKANPSTGVIAGPSGPGGFPLPRGRYRVGRGSAAHGYASQDFPAAMGTPIYSIKAGTVSRALKLNRSYGWHAIVNHGGGLSTLYAHMSSLFVRPGQKVGRGQQIGKVGSTGNSTGPHLHFEARRGGSRINPRSVISYDKGGWLPQGASVTVNNTGQPERIMAPHDKIDLTDSSLARLAELMLAAASRVTGDALTGMARSSAAGLRYA